MKDTDFDECAFFRSLADSHARALLIGRRAMVVLGLPVLTADYDFWLHIEDIESFNSVAGRFDLTPTLQPEEARRQGRYVVENDEHVDVLVARSVPTVDGVNVEFEDLWNRRRSEGVAEGVVVHLPTIPDLILTKRFAARPKDLEDIRLLEILRAEGDR
ncbi:MAG: hypothetical protein ACT4QD_12765 [Acidobacteriota bacterium]